MRVWVLGDIRAGTDSHPALISNERQQRILAALVLAGPAGLGVEQLATRVWDEGDEPPDAVRALRTYVNRLRNAIGENGDDLVATRPGGYLLAAELNELDATVFEHTAAAASRELDPYVALELYDEALGLWAGAAYQDLAHLEWVRPEAVRLDELRLTAEEARLRIRLEADHHADVAADAERLILENPYRRSIPRVLRERDKRMVGADTRPSLYPDGRPGDRRRPAVGCRNRRPDHATRFWRTPGARHAVRRTVLDPDPLWPVRVVGYRSRRSHWRACRPGPADPHVPRRPPGRVSCMDSP